MANDTEDIKTRLDIAQLIGESVPLTKAGRNFKGLCPFHNEKTPSFMVSPERGSWHCFGCDEGGDIFDFVMKRDRVDFPEALRMLAKRAGVELKGFDAKAGKAKQRLFEANEIAVKYFQAALAHKAGKTAREYLKSRGVSAGTAGQFRIGYAPDDYDALVNALKKKSFTGKELVDSGLALAGRQGNRQPYSRFRGRLMIPITDVQGVTRGFTGRVLDPEAKEAKYVNTPETQVYHKGNLVFALDLAKDSIIGTETAVLVEGQMDVIAAHQAGMKNVIAVSGTALTEDQLRLISRYADNLVLALDADDAGRKAMLRAVELVGDRELELKVADLGGAKDPDELIAKDPKAWEKAVAEAQPVIDYLMNEALEKHEAPYDRGAIKAVLDAVLPALRHRPGVDQDYYADQLANTLGVRTDSVKERLKGIKAAPGSGGAGAKPSPVDEVAQAAGERTSKRKHGEELVSERMLGLVVVTPALGTKLDEINTGIFTGAYREAAEELKRRYTKRTKSGTPDDVRTLLDVCALSAAEYDSMNEEERAAEFDRLYARLKTLWVHRFQPKLMAAIKRAEAAGKTDRRDELMKEYLNLTKEIVHG
ncbi:MAG: DNA primase [bacterium]|nr:DNA primase [bacterium]